MERFVDYNLTSFVFYQSYSDTKNLQVALFITDFIRKICYKTTIILFVHILQNKSTIHRNFLVITNYLDRVGVKNARRVTFVR